MFERLGGRLRLGDPVTGIATLGDRATGVTTASGWTAEAAAVAINADVMHSYRDLLSDYASARRLRARLERTRRSPPMFTVHFGSKGKWQGIVYPRVLFGPSYEGRFNAITDQAVMADELAIL